MKRIVLCFFGVIPRSIKYTYESIKQNIIDVIKDHYIVTIYVFNLNVNDKMIDGVFMDQNDVKIIPYDIYEEELQDEIDKQIHHFRQITYINFPKYCNDYDEPRIQNSIRQLYSECRVGQFLEKNIDNYDVSIVCGPDFYIANPISIHDIESSYTNNEFYTTYMNDAGGYTNGFYIGTPRVLINPLKRIQTFHLLSKTVPYDYEFVLKQSLIDNNICRHITKLIFFKVRADKKVFWAEWDRVKVLSLFNPYEISNILCAYDTLLCNLEKIK